MKNPSYDKRNDYDFQINDVDFVVPPTSISVHKEGLNYSIKSLRTKSSVKLASGNGIYHVQVNITVPPQELLSLHRLICQVKNNPFVYVKNAFLKDSLEIETGERTRNSNNIFFTLMGLNINNHPASPKSFIVELDLRYFNNKPYIENLEFFEDVKYGNFSVAGINASKGEKKLYSRVSDPKESKIYVRYSNYLQTEYLKKYFNINSNEHLYKETAMQLAQGKIRLDKVAEKESIIKAMYELSEETIVRTRSFINIKLDPDLESAIETIIKHKQDDKDKKGLAELINQKKGIIDTKLAIEKYENKSKFESPEILLDPNGDKISKEEITKATNGNALYDFIRYGKVEYLSENEQGIYEFKVMGEIKDEGGKNCPFIFLPAKMTLKSVNENSIEFMTTENEIFIIGKVENSSLNIFQHYRKHLRRQVNAGSPIAIFSDKETFTIKISKTLFNKLPYGKKIEEYKKAENKKAKKNIEKFKVLDRFISENFQPYIDRKFMSNNVYEAIVDINFRDYIDYRKEDEVYAKYDSNTVITGVNGSLRHITPSIPILGQETPTHQFLGSMEPSYQISFIGKGNFVTKRMPDSFLNLEKVRQDSQANAKAFSEIPDAANFAISSLITKLLGSYEASAAGGSLIRYGSGEVRHMKDKFNFSVNSMSTFTVEGQPNTYGLNMHFQETRSYKEEEIRPAYTNYAFGQNLSAEFFNEAMGTQIQVKEAEVEEFKALTYKKSEPLKVKKKTVTPQTRTVENSEDYKWMAWKTKYITADDWYSRPKKYDNNPKNVNDLKEDGREISIPLDKEMAKVKKYFVDKNYEGDLWKEPKKAPYSKLGSIKKESQDFVNPDYTAFALCKTVSLILDYLNILYPEVEITKNVRRNFNSTLRINSNINFVASRGNHKIGSAIDLKFRGINATEAGIYIYLMQRLGYIPDYLNKGRSGVFLGMGFYGSKTHLNRIKDGGYNYLHLDLNAKPISKFVIEDNGTQNVFHVPVVWRNSLRSWAYENYYFNQKSDSNGLYNSKPHIGHILGRMKRREDIDKNTYADNLLKPFGFETMKTYRERLEAAHEKLIGSKPTVPEGKNLINFWETKLKKIVSEQENIDINNLELNLPSNHEYGANFTIATNVKYMPINLNSEDATNKNWYPASTIKFVAAIGCVYNLITNHNAYNVDDINLIFTTNNKRQETKSLKTILEKAIKESDNDSYSLSVAIATHKYISNELLEGNSIVIRRPFGRGFNGKGSLKYTREKSRWKGYADIIVRDSSGSEISKIDYNSKSHENSTISSRGSSEGTVEDFTKFMMEFIDDIHPEEVFGKINEEEYTSVEKNKQLIEFLKSCLAADKSHYQTNTAEQIKGDLQNKLKYSILNYSGFNEDEFTIYHKPGLSSTNITYDKSKPKKYFASDCLYFKNNKEEKDSFGITLWGEGGSSYRNREFMTSDSNGTYVSLTKLLGYCIKYSAELKKYLKEE